MNISRRAKVLHIPKDMLNQIMRENITNFPGAGDIVAVAELPEHPGLTIRVQCETFPIVPHGTPLPVTTAVLEKRK